MSSRVRQRFTNTFVIFTTVNIIQRNIKNAKILTF